MGGDDPDGLCRGAAGGARVPAAARALARGRLSSALHRRTQGLHRDRRADDLVDHLGATALGEVGHAFDQGLHGQGVLLCAVCGLILHPRVARCQWFRRSWFGHLAAWR